WKFIDGFRILAVECRAERIGWRPGFPIGNDEYVHVLDIADEPEDLVHDRFEFSFFAIKPALEKLSRIARKIHGLLAVPNLHRIDAGEDLIVEGPEAEGIAISHLPVKSGVDEINQDLAATVV